MIAEVVTPSRTAGLTRLNMKTVRDQPDRGHTAELVHLIEERVARLAWFQPAPAHRRLSVLAPRVGECGEPSDSGLERNAVLHVCELLHW
jgi:hypothetical protein